MTNLIATDSQKQEIDSPIVDLFALTLPDESILYFHPGVDANSANITFRDSTSPYTERTYVAFPILMDGMEQSSDGAINRPTLTVANIANSFSGSSSSKAKSSAGYVYKNKDLIGCKITRRQTLQKYLSSGSSTSPPTEYPKVTYLIDRVGSENNISVNFELSVSYDLEGISIPRRITIGKYCSWMYQGYEFYAKGGCTWQKDSSFVTYDTSSATDNSTGYTHNAFFDLDDKPLVLQTWLTSNTYPWSGSGAAYTQSSYVSHSSKYWLSQYEHTSTTALVPGSVEGKAYWTEVRPYTAHAADTDYEVGDLVLANTTVNGQTLTTIWYCTLAHDSDADADAIVPKLTSSYWRREELCGKTLNSCKCRYQAIMVSDTTAGSPPKSRKDTGQSLPFGSFIGTTKF